MPLEVRQIAIRMSVGDAPPPRPHAVEAGPPVPVRSLSPEDRAAIVGDCTRAVLAALARRAER